MPAAHPADGSLVASGRCVAGRARWTDHWFGAVGSEGLEGGMDGGGGGERRRRRKQTEQQTSPCSLCPAVGAAG